MTSAKNVCVGRRLVESPIAVLVLRSHATLESSLCDVLAKVPSNFSLFFPSAKDS